MGNFELPMQLDVSNGKHEISPFLDCSGGFFLENAVPIYLYLERII